MNNYLCILFIILFFTGCNKIKEKVFVNTDRPTIEVEDEFELNKFELTKNIQSDFYSQIDSIQLIKLEQTDETIIGKVSCLYVVRDTLFVVDYSKAKAIFAFDMNGSFLYKIDKIGNGPGEYQSLNMVQISDNSISIIDWFSWKFIRYDLKGNFLSEQRLDKCPSDFIALDQDKLLVSYRKYTNTTPFKVELISLQDSTRETAFPFTNERSIPSSSGRSRFQKINNKVLFFNPLNDTIFQIIGTEIKPLYDLNLNTPALLSEFYSKNRELKDLDFSNKIRTSHIADVSFFAELEDWIYVSYFKDGLGFISIISKEDYQSRNFLVADVTTGKVKNISFFVIGFHGNSLLTSLDESFFSIYAKDDQEQLFSHLKSQKEVDLINGLKNSNNNPIVCIFHIKNKKQ
jgi:hypothetical protein